MTFVGKILVIIIMVFALFFLAISTVVFSTHQNWKEHSAKLQKKVSELESKARDADTAKKQREAELAKAQQDFQQQTAVLKTQIQDIETAIQARQTELTEQRVALAEALERTKASQDDAAARKAETDELRKTLDDVQRQANELQEQKLELVDRIRVLDRELETATTRNGQLRERVAVLSSSLRRAGLPDNPQEIANVLEAPQDVEGQIKRVGQRNQLVEISIGSDDGLSVNHELEVYRPGPNAQYLGKIKIVSVDPDQAVGQVIGGTRHGIKLQEGDIVTPTIRSRR